MKILSFGYKKQPAHTLLEAVIKWNLNFLLQNSQETSSWHLQCQRGLLRNFEVRNNFTYYLKANCNLLRKSTNIFPHMELICNSCTRKAWICVSSLIWMYCLWSLFSSKSGCDPRFCECKVTTYVNEHSINSYISQPFHHYLILCGMIIFLQLFRAPWNSFSFNSVSSSKVS
jgi:hypothetical protein